MPAAFTFILTTVAFYALQMYDGSFVPKEQLGTLVTLTYTFGGLFALFYACQTFNRWKIAMYVGIWAIVLVAVCIPVIATFLDYVALGREQFLLLLVGILASPFILYVFMRLFQNLKSPLKGKLTKRVRRKIK